jgi:hypothetical protein
MEYAVQHQIMLSTVNCCSCGIVFAMPDSLMRKLKENGDWLFCPNGHRQHFCETEADRLRKMLEQANRSKTTLTDDYAKLVKRTNGLEREKKRLMSRVSAGVCPCCNRTFANLARHMASQHKGA